MKNQHFIRMEDVLYKSVFRFEHQWIDIGEWKRVEAKERKRLHSTHEMEFKTSWIYAKFCISRSAWDGRVYGILSYYLFFVTHTLHDLRRITFLYLLTFANKVWMYLGKHWIVLFLCVIFPTIFLSSTHEIRNVQVIRRFRHWCITNYTCKFTK